VKEICNLSLLCKKVYRVFNSTDVKVKNREGREWLQNTVRYRK